jgi:hypothetical protein
MINPLLVPISHIRCLGCRVDENFNQSTQLLTTTRILHNSLSKNQV